MIINRANLDILFTGYQTAFNTGFDGPAADYHGLVMEVNSTTAVEQYGWLGSSSVFREWVGDRVLQNLSLHDYSIKNKSFENTVVVSRDAIEDGSFGIFTPLMKDLGQKASAHPSVLVWNLMKSGFTEKCYDGQPMFDADHPVTDENGVEQSVSNYQAGGGRAWFLVDESQALKPIIKQNRRPYTFAMLDKESDENVVMRRE